MSETGAKPFDLEERTAMFGDAVIDFAKRVPTSLSQKPTGNRDDLVIGYFVIPSSLGISSFLRHWVFRHSFVIGYFVIRHLRVGVV